MSDLSIVDTWDFLERCDVSGARPSSGGDEVNFSCPFPGHSHGDESPSAYMNVESTRWFCHGCHRKGDAVSFYTELMNVSRVITERFLRETYGITFNEPKGGSMAVETDLRFAPQIAPPPLLKPSMAWLAGARLDWNQDDIEPARYMLDRGFSRETLIEWDVGYDYSSDRLTIPIFDIAGELIGIKGRAYQADRKPKYLILGDRTGGTRYGFQPYESSEVVFGLHRNREHRQGVLLEGELNAIALAQMGVTRPIATGMSYFSKRHAELVLRELDELVIFYDSGQAGYDGVWGHINSAGQRVPGIVEALESRMRVRVVVPDECDPADMLQMGIGQAALDLIAGAQSSLAWAVPHG